MLLYGLYVKSRSFIPTSRQKRQSIKQCESPEAKSTDVFTVREPATV